jgi:hypothetical protein
MAEPKVLRHYKVILVADIIAALIALSAFAALIWAVR